MAYPNSQPERSQTERSQTERQPTERQPTEQPIPPYPAQAAPQPTGYGSNPGHHSSYPPREYQPPYPQPDYSQSHYSQSPSPSPSGHPPAGHPASNPFQPPSQAQPPSPYSQASYPPHYAPGSYEQLAEERRIQARRLAARRPSAQPRPPAQRRPSALTQEEPDDFVPYFRAQKPYRPQRSTNLQFWVLGGVLLVGLAVLVEPTRVISSIVKTQDYDCQEVVQPQAVLSRDQLTQLLAIPERAAKEQVREVIREPYCLLPSIKIRSGVSAVREAYPLESDPDTWVVMLYEGDEYAGYRFNAR